MNIKGVIKYKILRMNKPYITENLFCNLMRTKQQKKLLRIIRQTGTDVNNLTINWDYISKNDKLSTSFIKFFKEYINFDNLSKNKNLKIKHINKFKDNLNWDILSVNYKFKIDELKQFKEYVNWQYIFFYQNYTKQDIKDNFSDKMWWLFPNETDTIVDENYLKIMEKIIHNNIREIPLRLADNFNTKLEEYEENKKRLKSSLKEELHNLFNDYDAVERINTLQNINVTIYDENTFIHNSTQTENAEEIDIETEMIVEMGPDMYESDSEIEEEIEILKLDEVNPFGDDCYDAEAIINYDIESDSESTNPFEYTIEN